MRRVVGLLKDRGVWDNTIVVLLADHGEAFGEGDLYFDHHGLYDAVTRVPLMIHAPDYRSGRVDALVSTEDLVPTLCDLAALPLPPYALTGTSVRPLMDQTARAVRDHVVLVESSRQASLALRTEHWKLIQPIVADASGQPLPDVYGRPRRPDPLLFDLEHDPGERHDLSSAQPERRAALERDLSCWRDAMATATGEPDPIEAQGLGLPYASFMERLVGRRT